MHHVGVGTQCSTLPILDLLYVFIVALILDLVLWLVLYSGVVNIEPGYVECIGANNEKIEHCRVLNNMMPNSIMYE